MRILGEVKPAYADVLRQADAIFLDELHAADLHRTNGHALQDLMEEVSGGAGGGAGADLDVDALGDRVLAQDIQVW